MLTICNDRIKLHVDSILSQKIETYQTYTNDEIYAFSLSIISHRRLVRTSNFNRLIKEFDRRRHLSYSAALVEKLVNAYSSELGVRDFNFQNTPISIQYTDALLKQLLDLSRAHRLSHPRVLSELARVAKAICTRLAKYGITSNISHADLQHELLLYLMENAEKNFQPAKASYVTYATTTIRFRGQVLFAEILARHRREVSSGFENDADTNQFHEKLQIAHYNSGDPAHLAVSNAVQIDSCDEVYTANETRSMMKQIFEEFSPLEQTLLYLKNQLHGNTGTFAFDTAPIIRDAEVRALKLLRA